MTVWLAGALVGIIGISKHWNALLTIVCMALAMAAIVQLDQALGY